MWPLILLPVVVAFLASCSRTQETEKQEDPSDAKTIDPVPSDTSPSSSMTLPPPSAPSAEFKVNPLWKGRAELEQPVKLFDMPEFNVVDLGKELEKLETFLKINKDRFPLTVNDPALRQAFQKIFSKTDSLNQIYDEIQTLSKKNLYKKVNIVVCKNAESTYRQARIIEIAMIAFGGDPKKIGRAELDPSAWNRRAFSPKMGPGE